MVTEFIPDLEIAENHPGTRWNIPFVVHQPSLTSDGAAGQKLWQNDERVFVAV
jgi:hypothetical protein